MTNKLNKLMDGFSRFLFQRNIHNDLIFDSFQNNNKTIQVLDF